MRKPKTQIDYDRIIDQLVRAGTLKADSATLGRDLYTWFKASPHYGVGLSPLSLTRCDLLADEFQHWHIV